MRSSTMGNRGLGDAHCGRSRGGLVLRRLAIWVIFYWEFRVACPRGVHLPPYSRPPPSGSLIGRPVHLPPPFPKGRASAHQGLFPVLYLPLAVLTHSLTTTIWLSSEISTALRVITALRA